MDTSPTVRLNLVSAIYEPILRESSASISHEGVNAPSTILLLPWMNASSRNYKHFISGYRDIFSTARVVVVNNSTVDHLIGLSTHRRHLLTPAVKALIADENARGELLIHALSNGGAMTYSQISRIYHAITYGRMLPAKAMVLDSVPGDASFITVLESLTTSLPRGFYLKWLMMLIIATGWGCYLLAIRLLRLATSIEESSIFLNDPEQVPTDAPRCYIYSKEDKIVRWESLENHLAEAERKGWNVVSEEFKGSPHIGHMRRDPKRYWAAVKDLWDLRSNDTK